MGNNRRTGWHWDKEEHTRRLHEAGSTKELSRRSGVNHATLSNAQKKLGIAPIRKQGQAYMKGERPDTAAPATQSATPGLEFSGDKATVIDTVRQIPTDTLTVEALMAAHDLSPEEWAPQGMRVNRWDAQGPEGTTLTLAQARLALRKIPDVKLIVPARLEGWKPPSIKPNPNLKPTGTRLIALFGDDHAPFNDKGLEEASLRWLADVKPDEWASMGDLMDLPEPSRWAFDPSWHATPQECVDAGAQILARRIAAHPQAERWYIPGNHCWRIPDAARDRLRELSGLRPAEIAGLPELREIFSLAHLLRLDELGVEYVEPKGKFHDAEKKIAPGLVARHRVGSPNKGGRERAARKKTCSFVRADDHFQGISGLTRWDDDRVRHTVWNVSIGAMCDADLHRKYTEDADWQFGFTTITVREDGSWHAELAQWDGEYLTWRGERW